MLADYEPGQCQVRNFTNLASDRFVNHYFFDVFSFFFVFPQVSFQIVSRLFAFLLQA